MAEAQVVGAAFLASPRATHAAGSATRNTITIKSRYTDARGRPCRVVEQTVMINAQPVRARGNVCQNRDGQWSLVP